jgi:hypothetical protein
LARPELTLGRTAFGGDPGHVGSGAGLGGRRRARCAAGGLSAGGTGRCAIAAGEEAAFEAADLRGAGFSGIGQETPRWQASFGKAGMRALYGSFPVMRDVAPERVEAVLGQVAEIAETQFGGRVERACLTVLYTAQKPGRAQPPSRGAARASHLGA